MNGEFSRDEDGQCNQKSDMHFNVAKKGGQSQFVGRRSQHDKDQQRQPREQNDYDQPAIQELQLISTEMQPSEKLEGRATQDDREIPRSLRGIGTLHGMQSLIG